MISKEFLLAIPYALRSGSSWRSASLFARTLDSFWLVNKYQQNRFLANSQVWSFLGSSWLVKSFQPCSFCTTTAWKLRYLSIGQAFTKQIYFSQYLCTEVRKDETNTNISSLLVFLFCDLWKMEDDVSCAILAGNNVGPQLAHEEHLVRELGWGSCTIENTTVSRQFFKFNIFFLILQWLFK